MTVKYLTIDESSPGKSISVLATMLNGDTAMIPRDHNKLWVAMLVATSTTYTVTPKLAAYATFFPITTDIQGNTYPRASFTDGEMKFLVWPGEGVRIAASADVIIVKSSK